MNSQVRILGGAIVCLSLCAAFTLGGVGTAEARRKPRTATLSLDVSQTVTIAASGLDVVQKSSVAGRAAMGCAQVTNTFRVGKHKSRAGTIYLTVRTLPSGSRFVFAELKASRKKKISASCSLETVASGARMHDLGLRPDLTYSDKTGVDRTVGPIGWVDLVRGIDVSGSVFVSRGYEYKILAKSYGAGRTSTVRLLLRETRAITLAQSSPQRVRLSLGMSAKRSSCQRYFLVSSRTIVDTATPRCSIGNVTRSEWRWMDPLGTYGKAPYSIEPETKLGYVRHLVLARAADTLDAYHATGLPLYEDLLLNDLYSLSLTRSADGLWRTGHTSTWLKSQSGITAPFIDTRNNEILALSARAMSAELATHGVDAAAAASGWVFPFADFLVGRSRVGAFTPVGGGAFFADYYDAAGTPRSHTSLNHALGEMNYLLMLYRATSNAAYLSSALSIKAAVDQTGTRWIRPNHDLWYQRNRNGTFTGTDYVTVTYFDLLKSQRLFGAVLGTPDPVFDQLIASKARFLEIAPPEDYGSSDGDTLATTGLVMSIEDTQIP